MPCAMEDDAAAASEDTFFGVVAISPSITCDQYDVCAMVLFF